MLAYKPVLEREGFFGHENGAVLPFDPANRQHYDIVAAIAGLRTLNGSLNDSELSEAIHNVGLLIASQNHPVAVAALPHLLAWPAP